MSEIKIGDIVAPSIDDVLNWLNFKYDRSLPDPQIIDGPYWEVPVFDAVAAIFTTDQDIPKTTKSKKLVFVKEKIGYNKKILEVWRRVE